MALPDLIEIVPLTQPVRADITVPGSKSITNRALVLAALAQGETTLQGALWSEDTQVMVECLQELGFMVNVEQDPNESCNRTITVYGLGGQVPRGGTVEQPMELFVGNAGTAARFLAAMVCLGDGVYRLHGVPRMHERPQAALFQSLRQLGYHIDAPNDKLPALIHGAGPKPSARCTVSIDASSQFASALLLSAGVGGWSIEVEGENADESPYVVMTSELVKAFPHRGGKFQIEPDASSGSYFWAAERFVQDLEFMEHSPQFGVEVATTLMEPVRVRNWPDSGWQIDQNFCDVLLFNAGLDMGLSHAQYLAAGKEWHASWSKEYPISEVSRSRDLGDSIMTAVILAPFAFSATRFTDLGRLRVQECERVVALRTELTKCGAKVIENGDTLEVFPSQLHGAEIETYNDHRMAMCFAILGLKVPGIKIKNPACVKKTFPNFFQKLAATPPHGLGATILDASGRKLTHEELFAD
jgi:3-phosphoshikimate 1-carboxyvinyltransferase